MQKKQNKNFQNFFQWSKKEERKIIEYDVTAKYHHLDTFYWKFLGDTSSFKKLAEVLKIIPTLLVEYGFSVNKSLLIESLATKSLIVQRIVYNHMKANSVSAKDEEIFPTLCCSVKHAGQRYSTYLEEQKKNIKFKMIDLSNVNKFSRKSQQLTKRKPW